MKLREKRASNTRRLGAGEKKDGAWDRMALRKRPGGSRKEESRGTSRPASFFIVDAEQFRFLFAEGSNGDDGAADFHSFFVLSEETKVSGVRKKLWNTDNFLKVASFLFASGRNSATVAFVAAFHSRRS